MEPVVPQQGFVGPAQFLVLLASASFYSVYFSLLILTSTKSSNTLCILTEVQSMQLQGDSKVSIQMKQMHKLFIALVIFNIRKFKVLVK